MTHARIHALAGEPAFTLCPIQHRPGGRQQPEAAADQDEACDVEWAEMRVGAPAEPHLQQMARVMAEPVHLRIVGAEPAAQDVQRQREAIHFGEQGHDEGGEHPEPPPVPPGQRLVEAPREEDEERGVDGGQEPKSVASVRCMHVSALRSRCRMSRRSVPACDGRHLYHR